MKFWQRTHFDYQIFNSSSKSNFHFYILPSRRKHPLPAHNDLIRTALLGWSWKHSRAIGKSSRGRCRKKTPSPLPPRPSAKPPNANLKRMLWRKGGQERKKTPRNPIVLVLQQRQHQQRERECLMGVRIEGRMGFQPQPLSRRRGGILRQQYLCRKWRGHILQNQMRVALLR